MVEGQLVLVGMPNTAKFRDLGRDPRFSLHTATVDPYLGDGDAKVWGTVRNLQDEAIHEKFAAELLATAGPDVRGQRMDPFYVAAITGASSLENVDGQLTITSWKPGEAERSRSLS
jgi:hypothetical protein